MGKKPLSPLAQLLWFKLMGVANRERWPENITVSNDEITVLLNVAKRDTAAKARKELTDAGYIDYTPGHKGSPGRYAIRSLCPRYYCATNEAGGSWDTRYPGITQARKMEIETLTAQFWQKYHPGKTPTDTDFDMVFQHVASLNPDEESAIDPERRGQLDYAFEAAVKAGVLNWNYINGILNNIRSGEDDNE